VRIAVDPGHGMSNIVRGRYDPGAEAAGVSEAAIAMTWANCLRGHLQALGHTVIRTRVDDKDPCPVWRRDDVAVSYKCQRMISLHCNFMDGRANGTEVFYRGADDQAIAEALAKTVSASLGTRNRGAKTEARSQHRSLAVMEFDKCWLIELAFIDHAGDRQKLLSPLLMNKACEAIAHLITTA
jgi:N-acetylmuramoyl-L-alanine amidase